MKHKPQCTILFYMSAIWRKRLERKTARPFRPSKWRTISLMQIGSHFRNHRDGSIGGPGKHHPESLARENQLLPLNIHGTSKPKLVPSQGSRHHWIWHTPLVPCQKCERLGLYLGLLNETLPFSKIPQGLQVHRRGKIKGPRKHWMNVSWWLACCLQYSIAWEQKLVHRRHFTGTHQVKWWEDFFFLLFSTLSCH